MDHTGLSEETAEFLKKMETALNNIVDPAVKEYLQLWKVKHDADMRFLCQSLNHTTLSLGKRIRVLADTTVVKEEVISQQEVAASPA
jgi:hypothetical protein